MNEKIESMLFERTAIAKKPEKIIAKEIEKSRKTDIIEPECIIQDPYVFTYLTNDMIETAKTLNKL